MQLAPSEFTNAVVPVRDERERVSSYVGAGFGEIALPSEFGYASRGKGSANAAARDKHDGRGGNDARDDDGDDAYALLGWLSGMLGVRSAAGDVGAAAFTPASVWRGRLIPVCTAISPSITVAA